LTLRGGDPVDQVLAYLHDKKALVVVDNCEHVVDGSAGFAERFLAVPSPAVVLATSREALSVDGERTMVLGRLRSEGVDAPAVRLFIERAALVDPGFVLAEADREVITAVCAHLDGLLLAIELAAARVSVLSPAELLAGLSDRFGLLSSGRRARRTLETALDWSYQLLGANEQLVLRTLGVFVDGFDLDAVAAVADISRRAATVAVEALLAKSLVVRVAGGERARFGLLESVKAYAEQHLVDADEAIPTRDRHLGHFHALATQRGVSGFSELRLGIRLRIDRGNLAAAFEWAAEQDRWTEAGELIAGSYAAFLLDGGGLDAATLLERATEACEPRAAGQADALRVALSHCLVWLNEWSTMGRIASALKSSSVPALRAFGHIVEALVTGFSDQETAKQQLARARVEVDAVVASNPSLTADIVAGYVPWIGARIAATAGQYEAALHGTHTWLQIQRDTDFYSTGATAPPSMPPSVRSSPAGRPNRYTPSNGLSSSTSSAPTPTTSAPSATSPSATSHEPSTTFASTPPGRSPAASSVRPVTARCCSPRSHTPTATTTWPVTSSSTWGWAKSRQPSSTAPTSPHSSTSPTSTPNANSSRSATT